MGTAAAAFDPRVEAAVLARYGVDPHTCTLRRLRVLIAALPPGYWPERQHDGAWSVEAHLLAAVAQVLLDDGLAYVVEGDKIFAEEKGNPQGAAGVAVVPDGQEDITIESAEECPGECIFIEVDVPVGVGGSDDVPDLVDLADDAA